MTNLKPSDITEQVRSVLQRLSEQHGSTPVFITAYQVLNRLPEELRERLVAERGRPGRGSGQYYAAANIVSDAMESLGNIEISFLDTSDMSLKCGDLEFEPSPAACGIYRLTR